MLSSTEDSLAAKSIKLSIIIPVYNEAPNVQTLLQEILAALPKPQFVYEIIFVDDGSTDDTRRVLQDLHACHEELRFISHTKNYGQSAALVTGAKVARYPILVSLDGDGQNDPLDIPKLLDKYTDMQTVILGNRKKRDDNFLRKISSRIGNSIRQSIIHDGCPDTGCSIKVFSRTAFLNLPHFNHMHRFLPALFKQAGFKLQNVPVNHRPRKFGTSKYGVMNRLFVGIHDLIGVRWLLKRSSVVAEVIQYD